MTTVLMFHRLSTKFSLTRGILALHHCRGSTHERAKCFSLMQMEVCTEGAVPGTVAPLAAAPASAASPEAAAKAQQAADEAAAKENYRLIHGILMILGWGLLVPLAIVEATRKADKWYD